MTMLNLFVILLSLYFFYVKGASVSSVTEASSSNQSSVPSVTEAPSANQCNQQNDENCADCSFPEGSFNITALEKTDSCNHKVCLMCYYKHQQLGTKHCPKCNVFLLSWLLNNN
ncbi:uncharacterized protein LOC126897476 [Daktulosphaira vitifoliae]|uniref:uncharacterized protein LOC126897476 n=1 Tax=Daktulosphaira vitifoliae TaxID=58002 RepID=UPI0021A9FEFE|nr:uncharacterized protein LOC126897476 [Daktulosphaira vitifoliae]